MMRVATAIGPLYPSLNVDLLIAGILFHDAGKLWENYLPETGFSMPFDELGEMVGHIGIGLEVVNSLWRKFSRKIAPDRGRNCSLASDDVRIHLLHLIAAHHGEMQLGSPVFPKTPRRSPSLHRQSGCATGDDLRPDIQSPKALGAANFRAGLDLCRATL
jgi:3'-5' exoribonuclease